MGHRLVEEERSSAAEANRSYRLLQQELIRAREQRDRQVAQLIRLNRLSNELLHLDDDDDAVQRFAETIVDVLDVSNGAVWLLDPRAPEPVQSVASCGPFPPGVDWHAFGVGLAARLRADGGAEPVLDAVAAFAPGIDLVDPIAARCLSHDGTTRAIVLAANTRVAAGMDLGTDVDAREMLALLGERVAVHLDNSEDRKRIAESEEQLELVLQGTNDGWWDWDLSSGTCFVSARWLEMAGVDGEARTLERFWFDRVHEAEREMFERIVDRALSEATDSVEVEVNLARDDGSSVPVLVRGTIVRDASGQALRCAGSIFDLTERKRHEDRVRRLAFYDQLTDLPNRRLLLDRLERELLAARRSEEVVAVLMIDLDRFKMLNDTHGHAAGDELLRSVASRLRTVVRVSDTVARLSGDEFIVILADLGTDELAAVEIATRVAKSILHALSEAHELRVGTIHHSASIGIAVSGDDDPTVETLLKRADVALYEAKAAGRDTLRVFRSEMQQRVDRRSALDARLRAAFDEGELHVRYQPQVDARGRVVGAEALMRWIDGTSDPVGPAEFIAIAEESGLIHLLGDWCLEAVCERLVAWEPHLGSAFRCSVNLSAAEFLHPDFVERVGDVIERTGAAPHRLRLEITEDTVLTDLEFAAERMNALRALGVEFSLDDFGTGYASLTYLRRLPVAEVKIDQSYVARFLEDPADAAIVRAIVDLCRSLDIRVVAEGVETRAQFDRLVEEGCDAFQGYLFGRASVPPADPRSLLERP